jgi:DNA-binding NarL/FixJ family response regulator
VLLDIVLPGMSGINAIRPIRARWPRADILVLTVHQDEDRIFQAFCAGAVGYLLKVTPPAQITEAIFEVARGGAPMSPSIARKVVAFMRQGEFMDDVLTVREHAVLRKLIEGKTNQQIADEMFVSRNTVSFHLKQIFEKLHVHTRTEAVAKTMQNRLLPWQNYSIA